MRRKEASQCWPATTTGTNLKADAVAFDEAADVLTGARLLLPELVARKREDAQTTRVEEVMKLLHNGTTKRENEWDVAGQEHPAYH